MPALHDILTASPTALDEELAGVVSTFRTLAGGEMVRAHGVEKVDDFLRTTPELTLELAKRYTYGRDGHVSTEYSCECGARVSGWDPGFAMSSSTCCKCSRPLEKAELMRVSATWKATPF